MKKLGRNLNIKNNQSAYTVAVAIALLLASVLLVTYYVALRPEPQRYMNIYLLDTQKKAGDYPEYVVAGVNSTFSVYVDVQNHNGTTVNFQVQVKVVSNMNPTFPVNLNPTQTLNGTVRDGETWENVTTTSLDQPGNYLVVYELWAADSSGDLQFTGNQCVLNIQVAPQNITG